MWNTTSCCQHLQLKRFLPPLAIYPQYTCLPSSPPSTSALQDLAAKVWPVSQQHLAPVRDTGYQAPIQTG